LPLAHFVCTAIAHRVNLRARCDETAVCPPTVRLARVVLDIRRMKNPSKKQTPATMTLTVKALAQVSGGQVAATTTTSSTQKKIDSTTDALIKNYGG